MQSCQSNGLFSIDAFINQFKQTGDRFFARANFFDRFDLSSANFEDRLEIQGRA